MYSLWDVIAFLQDVDLMQVLGLLSGRIIGLERSQVLGRQVGLVGSQDDQEVDESVGWTCEECIRGLM